MNTKNNISRMTIDLPQKHHKQLKAISALLGKSMREIVIESIENYLEHVTLPNKKTRSAISDVEDGKDLVKAKNIQDLFKKLGI